MSASDAAENALAKLMFQNIDWVGIGDAGGLRGSVVAGSFWMGLATGDPGEIGTEITNEANYAGYARVAVPRDIAHWTVSGASPTQVANALLVLFPLCTAVPNNVTHFFFGRDQFGPGMILLSGPAPLAVGVGITPEFAPGAAVGTFD